MVLKEDKEFALNGKQMESVREETNAVSGTSAPKTAPRSEPPTPRGRSAWPGGWGPQGMRTISGGGPVRVPNLRVCKHLFTSEWHTQGEKDELTSCRGAVWSAW